MSNNILGYRIKSLREEAGLTQLEYAKMLNISNTTLSQYEAGNRIPSDEIKAKIADFHNVSIDYLLGRTNVRNSNNSTDEVFPDDVKVLMRSVSKLTDKQKEIVKRLVQEFINED